MAGITTPQFVAASANAGILGAIGAGYLSEDETRAFIREVKQLTTLPFMVNLFVPEEVVVDDRLIQKAVADLAPIRQDLKIEEDCFQLGESPFDEQIDVIIEEGVTICSFTFGLPDEGVIQRLKAAGVYLIGTATTQAEALLAEEVGMDAVVVQGSEAGGHRGSFAGEQIFMPLHKLLEDVVNTVQIPVIAAGGIANKALADDALSLGAAAIQIGTALLAAKESGAHHLHKEAVLQSTEGCTVITKAFSGKAARGIYNQFIERMERATIAPYPLQNDLTKGIRKEAARQGEVNYMSLWAGEKVYLSKGGKLNEVIERFIEA